MLAFPPPPKMPMRLALAYAAEGYFVRPLGWTGVGDAHDLAWLHYPAGAPLAYYWDGTADRPGRPWLADDLTRAEWLGWWTALPPACFESDVTDPPCLCAPGDAAYQWVIYEDEIAPLAGDDVANPNAIMGLQNCSGDCDCAGASGNGTSSSSGSDTSSGGASGGSGGSGGGSGGGGANPRPSVSFSGSGSGKGRTRPPKRPLIGPRITVTATLTDPADECVATQEDRDHTWSIEVALSSVGGEADLLYSVQLRILGAVIDQWMLAPGESGTADYTRSLSPVSASFLAIGSGSAFGGGPACLTGTTTLEPLPICPENRPPVAVNDSWSADADDGNATLGNVILNDSDPDSNPLSVTPQTGASGSNGGLFTLLGNGSLSFNPDGDFADLDGGETRTTSINYTLLDGLGGNDTGTASVVVTGVEDPLVAVGTIPDQSSDEGEVISLNVSGYFSDPDDTVDYAASGLPSGLSIGYNGVISGTIADGAESSSPYSVTITASAAGETDVDQTFSWAVTDPPPSAVGVIPNQNSEEGESISFDVSSYFSDDDTLSYSAGGLPTGLSIHSSTGVISGTIANESAGTYNVTVTAAAGGDDVDQTFDWFVTDPVPQASGTIPDQSNPEGTSISLDVSSYFSDDDTLSYSSSTLPPGLSISAGTISGSIGAGASSGSPYAVTITATDGDNSVDQTFDWTIT